MTIRAVAYLRVSTNRQETSLETQEQMARDYCARLDWELVGTYTDRITGKTDKRPGLQQLLADAASKPRRFEMVVFYKVDRLARRARFWYEAFGVLEDNGIDIRSLTQEGIANTRQGRIMLHALIMAAEIEGDTIVDRVRDNQHARAARGEFVSPRAPFGYVYVKAREDGEGRKVPGRLELDVDEAALVQEAFAKYLELGSARQVAAWMNARGETTKTGSAWTAGFVTRMIRNPVYKGERVFGRHRVERTGRHRRVVAQPPATWMVQQASPVALVSPADWDAANRILDRSSKLPAQAVASAARQPWSRLLRCAGCQAPMYYVRAAYPERVYETYVCSTVNTGGLSACPVNARVRRETLEGAILPWLDGLHPVRLQAESGKAPTPARRRKAPNIEDERTRWNTMYGKGRVSLEAWEAKMQELDERAAQAVPTPPPAAVLPPGALGLAESWSQWSAHDQAEVLAGFLEAVVVEHGGMWAYLLAPEAWERKPGPEHFPIPPMKRRGPRPRS